MVSFFAHRDYIAHNLCVNRFDRLSVCKGSCFLERKLADNENKDQKFPELKMAEYVISAPLLKENIAKADLQILPLQKWFVDGNTSIPSKEYLNKLLKPPVIC